MAIHGVDTKCYILALFVRDDGERFLLGSGHYEFKDTQMHFAANAIQNDIVEVQGNDGFLLAGQVRRPGTQSFDGYVGDGTMSKEDTESYRRQFFSFFRKNFFYKVIYVFSDGTAIQRKRGFLVDDPTVQELYQIYPEYHVALNFEDVNYYSYSEDDEGHEQYAKEADIDLSSMRATGGLIWDNLGVVWESPWGDEQSVSGTELTIQNNLDLMVPVNDEKIEGDTYQQTYSGKNLFNKNLTPFATTSSTTVEVLDTGIKVQQTVTSTANLYATYVLGDFSSFAGQSVTLSCNIFSSGQNIARLALGYCKADGSSRSTKVYIYASSGQTTLQLSASELAERPYLYIYAYANSGSGNGQANDYVEYTNLQLEFGSTATSYEPYVGGIPAPNPDYPQAVNVVTGTQKVGVYGQNLFNVNDPKSVSNGVTVDSDGWITVTRTNSGSSTIYANYFTGLLPLQTNTNYLAVLEVKSLSGGTAVSAVTSSAASQFANGASYNFSNIEAGGVYTTIVTTKADFSNSTYSLRSTVQINAGVSCSITYRLSLLADTSITPQTFSYEPYRDYTVDLGSIELCKIGDYQDYIYKSGDDWYVHKEIDSVTISCNITAITDNTGSSSASGQSYAGAFMIQKSNWDAAGGNYDGTIANAIVSYNIGQYKQQNINANAASNTMDDGTFCQRTGTNDRIYFRLSRYKGKTGNEIKALLLSNGGGSNFYYYLSAPTDTKITDTSLISQLNALGAMRLFIGGNNLTVQATGTNLPGPISFKYYTSVNMTGAEWEEGGSGGATVVEVDSITNIYPIWKVTGPAVNPALSVITTNTTIQYSGTITGTQTLEVDMFNKTAKLNGASVIGNISGDWVNFSPGTNRVLYTADNTDALPSTIEWQEVVG